MIIVTEIRENISDYTESEFTEIVSEFYPEQVSKKSLSNTELENYLNELLDKIIYLVGSVTVSDFIYYPNTPEEDNPESVIKGIKKLRKNQGLALFKNS
ncbi:bacteriocin immunity protein [Escherichia sp. E4385]|uniref:bacteriocin immunity protein n=1 Tax=Escherichia sp. E4385 TaxID=2040639 RepID=UPI00107EF4CC|nr:bacteriocin immunity protein [Escherichia sp. E4385]TGC12194.1 bacteriocin immunity protein [Escherichia sp. E4385]TLJ03209.1 bacteriocin immunity protein [Escherichia sp. E4385]